MQVLIIRHAIAGDRDEFAETGRPDAERPLTPQGRRRMRRGARGLRRVVPALDVVATSPLVRAQETADLVARAYRDLTVTEVAALAPDGEREDVLERLHAMTSLDVVALVGHEPALSQLVGWFVTGRPASVVELKKGAACLVTFAEDPAPGGGVLRWLLPPALLRALGRRGG